MADYFVTFLGYPVSTTAGTMFVASSGLTSVIFKAQPSETVTSTATEIADGFYKWIVPGYYKWKCYANGNEVDTWGGDDGKYVPNSNVTTQSYVDTQIAGRVDRGGDNLTGPDFLSYWGATGLDCIAMTGGNIGAAGVSAVPTMGWIQNKISSSTATINNLLTSNNTWSGTNWFSGGLTGHLGSTKRISIFQSPALPNGDIFALDVYPQSTNKTCFDFKNSVIAITGSGSALINDLRIQTSASKYIIGNPANNDYVWRKWVVDNFQSISNPYYSNTIIVDPKVVGEITGSVYPNITDALVYITGQSVTSTNIWTLFIKQHYNHTTGYAEDVALPDWINAIGEGQVLITGQLTRTGTETIITSTLANLTFKTSNSAHDVDRFEAINCVFNQTADGDVVLTDSILRNSGFYANNVQSNGGNKLINCFGNYNISLSATDKDYGYKYIPGDTY